MTLVLEYNTMASKYDDIQTNVEDYEVDDNQNPSELYMYL